MGIVQTIHAGKSCCVTWRMPRVKKERLCYYWSQQHNSRLTFLGGRITSSHQLYKQSTGYRNTKSSSNSRDWKCRWIGQTRSEQPRGQMNILKPSLRKTCDELFGITAIYNRTSHGGIGNIFQPFTRAKRIANSLVRLPSCSSIL